MTNTAYQKLAAYCKEISQLGNILGILGWDTATMMQPKSSPYRAEDMSLLQGLAHERMISAELGELLAAATDEFGLDEWQVANIREIKRDRDNSMAVSEDLVKRSTEASIACEMIWRKARKENDYQMLLPHLERVVELARETAASRASYFNCGKYDAMLDMYDPNRKSSQVRQICDELTKFLPDFIQTVVERQRSEPIVNFEGQIFPDAQQKELGVHCMKQLGFDFEAGRLDISTHPFCGGNSRDIRLTTRYNQKNFLSGLMGILHETGHAMYEQNLPDSYKTQAVGQANGMSLHESQSLLAELQIGRSREFIEFIQPAILKTFNVSGTAYSADNLYNTANRVKPSLIRVDADEITYPIHVILRFKLEQAIIAGDLNLKDLPGVWNEQMKSMLGIEPDSDSNGCMQDMHWPSGAFGYFPTYMLGAILSAQLFEKIQRNHPTVRNEIRQGNLSTCMNWLKQNIHSKGRLHSVSELITKATGRDLDVECYKRYLTGKYLG